MPEYEFSNEQNETFEKLAGSLQRFAIIFGIFGLMMLGMGIADLSSPDEMGHTTVYYASMFVGGIVCIVLGLMFLKPVANFKRITTTKGQDITELLNAMGYLNASHNYLRIVLAVFLVASIIAVILNTTRPVS